MNPILKQLPSLTLMALGLTLLPAHAEEVAEVKNGVVYEAGGQEMARFGVNYNTPFAFGYRALKARGIDPKAAIDMDVDHIARLGLDAYRIHVWDREISDEQGNLLDNEHLELFDYLLMRLAEHNIKSLITTVAWWGNGYPEPDQPNRGFAQKYSKNEMNTNPQAIAETQRYLKQLVQHKNRYTQVRMMDDPNILAFELFNEPKHTDPESSQEYVNGLVASMRSIGVTKPLFYNIAEQGDFQEFARKICESDLDGIAYQWYPTGLVKKTRINTNVLANVASYYNPFAGIESCASKAKMIYEFDAADVTSSVLYPAMARSFRAEGFQWATQFAYDPAVIAETNAEYNTHYLNLLYTPKKALGLMVAGHAFRQLPRNYEQPDYPDNNEFGDIRIDYHQDLALLNQPERFIYSNSNDVKPVSVKSLQQIAGTGQSKLVSYQGTGAYFLDKLGKGQWRLEVYPDVVKLDDPHRPGSLKREVNRLYSAKRDMQVSLKDLGKSFWVAPLSHADKALSRANKASFEVEPGIYLLSAKKPAQAELAQLDANYYLPAAKQNVAEMAVWHQPQRAFNQNDDMAFEFTLGSSVGGELKAELYIRYKEDRDFSVFPMADKGSMTFSAKLPSDWQRTGILEYAFVIHQGEQVTTFPGGAQGHPNEWDFVEAAPYWQTRLQKPGSLIELFDASQDWSVKIYPKNGHAKWEHAIDPASQRVVLKLGMDALKEGDSNWLVRLEPGEDNGLANRKLKGYKHLLIKVKGQSSEEFLHLGLMDQHGLAYGTDISVNDQWQYKLIPLSSLKPVTSLLTQSYPMFMPVELDFSKNQPEQLSELNLLQGIQLGFATDKYSSGDLNKWHGVEIELIGLYAK